MRLRLFRDKLVCYEESTGSMCLDVCSSVPDLDWSLKRAKNLE